MRRFTVLAIAAPVFAALAFACSSPAEPDGGVRFYTELEVVVEPDRADPLTRAGVETEGGDTIRWWYRAPDRWRWEIETAGSSIDAGTRITVSDGEAIWTYDDRSNTYQKAEAYTSPYALSEGLVPSPTFNAPVGPANAASVEAFMEQWRQRGVDTDVRLGGEETVLGRRTSIVEIRPAWRSSSSAATAPSTGEEPAPAAERTESSGGVVRVFIDPERMFIMRWAVDGEGGGQSYSAEVTTLQYGDPIDGALFAFEPPAGAREVESEPGEVCSSSLGDRGFSAPVGFLRPSYVPPGFGSGASGAESGVGCTTVAAWSLLEDGDGGWVLLRQRVRTGIPEALRTDDPVSIDGRAGFSSEDTDIRRVVWRDGDLLVELTSNTFSIEELVRIAESAERVTETSSATAPDPAARGPLWYLPLLNEEEAKPRPDRVLSGITVGMDVAPVFESCVGADPVRIDIKLAYESELDPRPGYLPADAEPGLVAPAAVSCGGTLVWAEQEFYVPPDLSIGRFGGLLTIYRTREKVVVLDYGDDRLQAATIGDRPAILIEPLTEDGFGNSAVVINEPFGITLFRAHGITTEELLRVAESLVAAGGDE